MVSFFNEYNQYCNTDYFLGCSFDVYKKTYNKRSEDYKNDFIDTDEISFITDELDEGIYNYKFKEFNSDYVDNDTILRYEKLKKQINYSLIKRFEYLCQRAKENGFDLVYNEISPEEDNYFLKHIKQPLETKKEKIKNIAHSPLLESNSTINETKPPIKNQHPSIFEDNAFDIFLKWLEISKDKVDMKKISFIIQKLKSLDKIRNSNFKYITQWLKDNDFIDEKTRQDFIVIGSFDASSKILTKARNNLYDTISTNKENR